MKKVLIVNDDDCARVGLKFELSNCNNIKVLEASNVSDALNLFTNNSVDIVISDLNLGDDQPSGYEFLKTVRETNKDIPFYIASGYSEGEEAPKAKSFGATGYLQLPLETDELKRMLE